VVYANSAQFDPRHVTQAHCAEPSASGLDHRYPLNCWVSFRRAGEGEVRLERTSRTYRGGSANLGQPVDLQVLGADRRQQPSPAVMPRVAILSGSSHSRIE